MKKHTTKWNKNVRNMCMIYVIIFELFQGINILHNSNIIGWNKYDTLIIFLIVLKIVIDSIRLSILLNESLRITMHKLIDMRLGTKLASIANGWNQSYLTRWHVGKTNKSGLLSRLFNNTYLSNIVEYLFSNI